MPETLLRTKLMAPRVHPEVIARPDLLERLDEGLTKRLTLLSAPTGFGKTSLVGMWLAQRKLHSAWVALDEHDNDPVRFWSYVITALRQLDARIGRTALALLSTAQMPSFQTILTPLMNELDGMAQPGVLVLEDYHTITSVEIHATLAFLLQHKPDSLHLVIISRDDPDLPLGILRARDQLTEITAADLRFQPGETEAFLRATLKIDLSPRALEKIQERTEGWAAGLRLASLALQNKVGTAAEQAIDSFSGSHRLVADYLIHEVLESLPGSFQDFLLKTCFLNRLTGSLCNAVTGRTDGDSILEQLERRNLFLVGLEHTRGRTWYRYSPLFCDAIQSLARQQLGEGGVQAIYEKASDWYAYQQLFDDAIETALAAGLFERALELLERYIEIYNLSEMLTLKRWMERIPDGLSLGHPAVCMMYAQVILFSSDRFAPTTAARIEPYLQGAERIWLAQGNEAKLGTVLALRGMMLLWQGEFQKSLAAIYLALEKMPEEEIFWRGVSLLNVAGGELYAGRLLSAQDKILEARALLGASQNVHGMLAATGLLSDIFFAQANLDLCVQLCHQTLLEAVGDESMLDDQGNARLNLGRVAYERNDLDTAAREASEAFGLAKQRANELLQAQAAGLLALVRAAKGDLAQAQAELKALAARLQSAVALEENRTHEALLAVRAGELPGAWLTSAHEVLPAQKEREAFILARWQIGAGKPAEAQALLRQSLEEASLHGRVRSQVEALCLAALARKAGGDVSGALELVGQALAIGREKGLRRLFLDEGAQMAALLRDAQLQLSSRTAALYAVSLLQLFPTWVRGASEANSAANPLLEPLSQQELRVLRLLAAGLSNSEIASELVVSTNTIKTHVKGIYRKLNINSREEARGVVNELHLFGSV
jgi:LuxR family maltose regulon positive regulatory protein